jgi:hypothetical protein
MRRNAAFKFLRGIASRAQETEQREKPCAIDECGHPFAS